MSLDTSDQDITNAYRSLPRKKVKHKGLPLKILVFELESDNPIREHDIDYHNDDTRKWLTRLIVWATTNNKSIEIVNINDDKK